MTTERRSHHQTSSFASASNGSSNESNNNQKQQKGTQKSAGCLRLHCALLLLLLVLAAAAFDSVDRADAVSTWRMRTDKKAMRNSLVRFGKRAYRPAGEAFVSAVELADGMPMMFGGGRAFNSMPSRQMASWYRQQQLAAAMERPGGGGGVEWTE